MKFQFLNKTHAVTQLIFLASTVHVYYMEIDENGKYTDNLPKMVWLSYDEFKNRVTF